MTRAERAVVLNIGSIVGIVILALGACLWFPNTWSEISRFAEYRSRLSSKQALEAQAQLVFTKTRDRVAASADTIAAKHHQLASQAWKLKPISELDEFVANLAELFSQSGVTERGLSYQSRVREPGFLTLPFQVEVEGGYEVFRKFLYLIETHPAGIFIDRLEFLSFDNERHQVRARIACLVRFTANEP